LAGRIRQELGDDLGAQNLDQLRIDRTTDQKEGLPIQRVYPATSKPPQGPLIAN
jgi:hypothetical protein